MPAREQACSVTPLSGRTVLICLILFFLVISLVNGIMIRFAVSTFGGVETASAYQAGLAFSRETAAARAQDARHWEVKASLASSGGRTVIEINARDAALRALAGYDVSAVLAHPTDRRADRVVPLTEAEGGRYRGTTEPLLGQWDVVIELSRGGERLFRSRNRVVLQ